MIDVDYPKMLNLFKEHVDPKRSENASFLIWYLEKYYRLDALEATDAVCDQSNDKGVDGIFVNDNDQTIIIFQSKISQKANSSVGDAALRTFDGTLNQFKNTDSIKNMVSSAGENQVAALIKRLDLINKIGSYEVRGEFLVNLDLDQNGKDFLIGAQNITFVGKSRLVASYISDERNLPGRPPATFDIFGLEVAKYTVDAIRKAIIAPVKATELVKLYGIEDQSIFAYNVRGPLGKTKINSEIVLSINDKTKHKLFPLFHNGITIIASNIVADETSLTISDYYVVNGCQSLSSLYNNSKATTDELRVLTKFIQMDPTSPEAGMITAFSNNQNGVRPRDFKANTPPQIRIQNEFKMFYNGKYYYEIKRGEPAGLGAEISNEDAGLYLMAFDLKQPWATHRKYEVFEDKHNDLFATPQATADRIVLCRTIIDSIKEQLSKIENQLFARYVLTQYAMLYIVREILEKDDLAVKILRTPSVFVRVDDDRSHFKWAVGRIVKDIVSDLNEELKEYGEDFDYRSRLRDSSWVIDIRKKLVSTHTKLINRGLINNFSVDWQSERGLLS
jgi:AIPR protein